MSVSSFCFLAKNVAAAAESYQESRTTKIVLAGTKGGGRANTRVFRAHGVKKSRADIDQHEYSAFASSSVAFFPSQAHDETLANDEVVIVGGLGAELVGTGEPVLVLAIRRSGPKLGGEATFAALLHRKWMKRNQPRKAGRIRRSNVRKRRSRLSQPKNPGGGSQEGTTTTTTMIAHYQHLAMMFLLLPITQTLSPAFLLPSCRYGRRK